MGFYVPNESHRQPKCHGSRGHSQFISAIYGCYWQAPNRRCLRLVTVGTRRPDFCKRFSAASKPSGHAVDETPQPDNGNATAANAL